MQIDTPTSTSARKQDCASHRTAVIKGADAVCDLTSEANQRPLCISSHKKTEDRIFVPKLKTSNMFFNLLCPRKYLCKLDKSSLLQQVVLYCQFFFVHYLIPQTFPTAQWLQTDSRHGKFEGCG
jgi:hypothetical protein